ncbi:uncharacterized protein LOC144118559 [Amblyomma americanum]|uniref:Uncharacterized protein n=1 Tax=Amblyomma americanum TaxID=6943 RepID=A0AAQ4FC72_AMBAM
MSWAVLARAILLGVLLDAGRRGHAASHEGLFAHADETPVPELTWRRLGAASEEPSTSPSGPELSRRDGKGGTAAGVVAVAEAGKPGKIVLLSAGQLLNGTGAYRVAGDDRVRKAAGFEVAYDYYFKPQDPTVPNSSFKSMTKKSMPLILATAFLVILVVCIAVCISGICWERTRRLVAARASAGSGMGPPDLPRDAAAGDSGGAGYGNDKYMI